jgi:hypothetical protein
MNYTIAETYNEATDTVLSVPGSYEFFGATTDRCAFVWTSYAEKSGVDYEQTVVRFFENMRWVDTWYPRSRETAERLAQGWATPVGNELVAA